MDATASTASNAQTNAAADGIDVFLSHSHADREVARLLQKTLAESGVRVWMDAHIRADETINDAVSAALQQARCVLVLWSKDANQSDWVLDEATYAREHRKLISARLDDSAAPLSFGTRVVQDLAGWNGERDPRYQLLLEKIHQLLARPLPPPPEIGNTLPWRKLALATTAIALLAAAIIVWFINGSRPRLEYRVMSADKSLSSGSPLCPRQKFHLDIQVLRRSHLYVFLEDSSGQVARLYPSEIAGLTNPVRGAVRIPRADDFELDDAAGQEQLYIYALPTALPDAQSIMAFTGAPAAIAEGNKGLLLSAQEATSELSQVTSGVAPLAEEFFIDHRAGNDDFCTP